MIIDYSKYDLSKAKELAKKYGAAVVTEMAFNIQQLDLVDRGILLKSLKSAVKVKDGEVDRIQFAYEWYGRIHEVGATNAFGKGVELPSQNWRSDAINSQMGELSDAFAQFYADLIVQEITIDSTKMEM